MLTALNVTICDRRERRRGWSTTAGDAELHAFTWTKQTGIVDLGTVGGSQSQKFGRAWRTHEDGGYPRVYFSRSMRF
jgi:probable HAF family extracellular repeat protein